MSGFKISADSLRPEFYQVVLTLTGGAGTYPTADGNDNGAVCPALPVFSTVSQNVV